eukprot:232323-Rhodomonas_salina.4
MVTCWRWQVSEAHRLILSGATDRTVLLWDTNRLRFMRELLSDLTEPPSSLSTSETGSNVIVTAGAAPFSVALRRALLSCGVRRVYFRTQKRIQGWCSVEPDGMCGGAGREMKVVSINGIELASIRMDTPDESFQCARPMGWPEWGCENPVIVSGHLGGVVRFWKLIPRRFAKASVTKSSSRPGTEVRGLCCNAGCWD